MEREVFFEESRDQSLVKARIVEKYFSAWSKVIIPPVKKYGGGQIAYIDLFAGPGRYNDGSKSTPLLILESAVNDDNLSEMLITVFNDKDNINTDSLKQAISNIPGIDRLRYRPIVTTDEIGDGFVARLQKIRSVPTLFFIDPWGYKGLSLQLIDAVLRDWGCDCIFFFNYNRINMGLTNPYVEEHMNALFGKERADGLRVQLQTMDPYDREMTIVEEMSQALRDMGNYYVLPFGFKNDRGTRTSHHLFFVSKKFRGYEIMKDIMARESSDSAQGVASFQYNSANQRWPILFELSRPLDDLEEMLLECYAGRTLTMQQLYEEHSIGKPYIKRNYKDILIKMEAIGRIIADPPAGKRRPYKGEASFGDKVKVIFPARST